MLALGLGTVLLALSQEPATETPGIDFYEKKIRPLLIERCYACHSAKAESVKGGLLLDTRQGLLKGGESGPAIVPGRPEVSLLVKAVRYGDEQLKMPPKVRNRLSAAEVADLEAWVRLGAPAPDGDGTRAAGKRAVPPRKTTGRHWSFQPLRGSSPAADIDSFILAKLKEKGLRPVGDADRRTLIRRATYDLIGLPPTPEDIDAFLADGSPDAFGHAVDRLLASPHYGERWGRHWLDLVRYADTAGDNSDYPVPQAYRYRDYVIQAFNEDKPYDRFLREQIAGDLLPARTDDEKYRNIIATGYVAIARRFGTLVLDYNPHQIIEDTIDTLGRSILGLTLGCARCHDHKFDPVTQADYYGLYGIFESTRYPFPGLEEVRIPKDFVPLMAPERVEAILRPFREKLAPLEAEVRRLEREREALLKEAAIGAIPPAEAAARVRQVDTEIGKAKSRRDLVARDPPPVEYAYAVVDAPRTGDARLHVRGDPRNLGTPAPRRFLDVLGGASLPSDVEGSGRLQLAGWLTDPRNPLTARVMVNRIWQHHFGKGLVTTPSDFGARGTAPTHPEVLDFLARRFVESGWSVKAMHRLILRSRTYGRSSRDDVRNAAADPDNQFLWKFPRRRLEAEAIRDAMLSVSGALERTMGGPHPFPPQKTWEFTQHSPFAAVYDSRRRTVYLMTQRFKKHPFLAIFDGADTNATTPQRTATLTPPQALFMMNDPFVREQARKFAARLTGSRKDDAARVELAYLLAFGRPPDSDERAAGEGFVRSVPDGWAVYSQALLSLNEFIFVE